MKKKSISILMLSSLIALCSGCISTEISPAFKLQVVDENDKPLPDVVVKQLWEHQGLESNSHREKFITDTQGFIDVPRRTITKDIVTRSVWFIWRIMWFWNPRVEWDSYMYISVQHSKYGKASFMYNQYEGEIPKKLVLEKEE
jgi:hypothetical protein